MLSDQYGKRQQCLSVHADNTETYLALKNACQLCLGFVFSSLCIQPLFNIEWSYSVLNNGTFRFVVNL